MQIFILRGCLSDCWFLQGIRNVRFKGTQHVAIIPMASAVPGSQWTIASGYGAAEDAQVHTLSEIVLKLAATNFIVNSLIRTIVLVVNLARGAPNTGLTVFLWLFWVSWACYVYWLGIQGVKTRNAPCCGDACCCAKREAAFTERDTHASVKVVFCVPVQ